MKGGEKQRAFLKPQLHMKLACRKVSHRSCKSKLMKASAIAHVLVRRAVVAHLLPHISFVKGHCCEVKALGLGFL